MSLKPEKAELEGRYNLRRMPPICRANAGNRDEIVIRVQKVAVTNEEAMGTSTAGKGDRDEVFDLLSNHRRRYTIHYCKSEEEPVSLSDLAEQITAWEQDKEIAEITSAERKTVYTSLQQTHLPTLAEAEMVHYENGEIKLTERANELDVYLDVVPSDSVPWGIYYVGLSGFGFAVLAGLWVGLVPTDPIPTLGWAALILALIAISAVVHVYQSRRYRLGEMETPP